MSKNKLFKAAGIVMAVSLISRLIGFVRDALIASSFGATYRTDAYIMSLTIPNIIFGIFGTAIATTFIPMLSESYMQNNKEDMYDFANSIMNILLILSLILFILGWIFTPDLVNVIAPKFKGKTYDLTVYLTKLSVINILFLSLVSGYTAVLQTLDEFTAPALVGIVMNLPILIYIFTGNKYGIEGLMYATLIGDGLQILVQIPWLLKNGYKYKLKINFKDPRIMKMLILIAPVLIGTGVNQINALVQNNMASGLPEGSIAALDYANKLNGMIYFTFAAAIVTVIFPSLSREGNSTDFTVFKKHISNAVNNMNLILIPCSVALIVLRVPIIKLLFMHGAFDERAVSLTSVALLYLVIGMVCWGVRDVFNRAFYAIQDTKTPMINGVLGVGINIFFSIGLVKLMGIGGLTLATSISALFSCVLLIKDLRKRIGYINGTEILVTGVKMFGASSVMGILIYIINKVLGARIAGIKGELIILMLCAVIGAGSYAIMLWLLKVKEFTILIDGIKGKIKEKRAS